MACLTSAVAKFRRDESGVSLVEYALLLALITLVGILAITALGNRINSFLSASATSI